MALTNAFRPEDLSWVPAEVRTDKGRLIRTDANIKKILEACPNFKKIRLNTFTHRVEVKGSLPWTQVQPGEWTDHDDNSLIVWLSEIFGGVFPKEQTLRAFDAMTSSRAYDPIKEYLLNLPEWDGTERVDTLFSKYLGAKDTPTNRIITRLTLISGVARGLKPGCKVDQCLVLVGPENQGKSLIWSKLGRSWYSDDLTVTAIERNPRDAVEQCSGWINEIPEMTGYTSKTELAFKGFISKKEDSYRFAYDRRVTNTPRHFIIVGSSNKENGLLTDVTGNRKIWIIRTSKIHDSYVWDLSDADIDQIWAEALKYYSDGQKWWLDPKDDADLKVLADLEQISRAMLDVDERADELTDYLDTLLPADWKDRDELSRLNFLSAQKTALKPAGHYQRNLISTQIIRHEFLKKQDYDMNLSRLIRRLLLRAGWIELKDRVTIIGYGRQNGVWARPGVKDPINNQMTQIRDKENDPNLTLEDLDEL